jgi:hypothetical protein
LYAVLLVCSARDGEHGGPEVAPSGYQAPSRGIHEHCPCQAYSRPGISLTFAGSWRTAVGIELVRVWQSVGEVALRGFARKRSDETISAGPWERVDPDVQTGAHPSHHVIAGSDGSELETACGTALFGSGSGLTVNGRIAALERTDSSLLHCLAVLGS